MSMPSLVASTFKPHGLWLMSWLGISSKYLVVLLSCGFVVLLSCCLVDRHYHKRTLQTTKQLNNQTTKQLNNQTTKQPNNQTTKQQIRLEACTEQSESNPGRSLGITDKKKAAVWKTVPSHPIKHQWIKIKLKMDKDIYIY